MLFLGMEGGSKGGAILTKELPERGDGGEEPDAVPWREGGSRGGAILTKELPERGDRGEEPDAVPWNERRVQGWSYSYQNQNQILFLVPYGGESILTKKLLE